MIVDEDVDARRVATAHFEAIDRRERLLDREIADDGAAAGVAPGERPDCRRRAQSIATDRPEQIAQADRRRGARLHDCRVEATGVGDLVIGSDRGVEAVEAARDRGDELELVDDREHPRHAREEGVRFDESVRGDQRIGLGTFQRSGRPVEEIDNLGLAGDQPARGTTDHADDATHGPSGYRPRPVTSVQPAPCAVSCVRWRAVNAEPCRRRRARVRRRIRRWRGTCTTRVADAMCSRNSA